MAGKVAAAGRVPSRPWDAASHDQLSDGSAIIRVEWL
jgi:hypothetical protein